jgi:hypothetical protein
MTAMPATTPRLTPMDRVRALEALGPRRLTGTPTEKAAQAMLGAELEALGYRLDWRPFTWTQSLYASLLLHFGTAALATGVGFSAPFLGAFLHALVALSYALESLRKGLVLRSLFPRIASQNLVATRPARSTRRKRLVLIAHADAAYTGLVFTPSIIKAATKQPPPGLGWFKKQLGIATASVAVMAGLELVAGLGVWSAPGWLRGLVTIPAVLTALANLDVVLRNRVVPGAADNLSGCTACVELAWRLEGRLPDDVELVIVISGAEEAGTGGAQRLAEQIAASGEWTPSDTIVLGLDTLTNGTLRVLEEGELWPLPIAKPLLDAVADVNAAQPEVAPVTVYVVPTGATDVLPFLVRGFPSVSLTCIDPDIGAARHYHHPTDTWSNMDDGQLGASIDFAERLILRLSKA